MQQSMRKQHEDSIEAYKMESADCEKRQEQIKIQNRQNYEKYHEGQMNQKQFMEAKMQLEEEKERLQKRVQELAELQIKIQNRQNYEKYHEGQMNQKQFMEAKMQLEEEKERLQKRVQELAELINAEKDILMKKNVPVEQMLKYLVYEKMTREMLEEYVQEIYVYDDGRVEVEWKER